MDFLKANYSSSSLSSDSESECDSERERESGDFEEELPIVPGEILNKYHIKPNLKKYTSEMKPTIIGKWSTFVYFEWRLTSNDRIKLDKILSNCNNILGQNDCPLLFEPLHWSPLGSPQPLHVTLCPNILFNNTTQREKFHSNLQSAIEQSNLKLFEMKFDPVATIMKSATNQKNVFLTLDVQSNIKDKQITELSNIIDNALEKQGKQTLFQFNPSATHMSIGQLQVPNSNQLSIPTLNNIIRTNCNNIIPTTPSFTVDTLRIDKNRESITINFPREKNTRN